MTANRQAIRVKPGMFESCVCVCVRADNTPVIIRCDVVQVVLMRRLEVLCVCVGTPVCCKCCVCVCVLAHRCAVSVVCVLAHRCAVSVDS